MPSIRPILEREIAAGFEILRRAGFGTTVDRLLGYPLQSPHGEVLVAAPTGESPVGIACCASFGPTGWIGALAVAPEVRGLGLGGRLTNAAVTWLRGRGAKTVLLYATDAGRPVYERLGFVGEGPSTAWRGTGGAREGVRVRRLGESDRPGLAALDRSATGEDRSAVLDTLRPLSGLAAERDGDLAGYAVASPWGQGRAIAAADADAGIALMAASTAGPEPGTLIVPDANRAATAAVEHWGFTRFNSAERMRLGPAPKWRPERQFAQFNLFWG